MILGIFVSPATIREVLELLFSRKLARWELTHVRNSNQFLKNDRKCSNLKLSQKNLEKDAAPVKKPL